MRDYQVTVSYRPHVSSVKREITTVSVTAVNRQAAVFLTGLKLGRENVMMVSDSVTITEVNGTHGWPR